MLAVTHSAIVNADIVRHIARADELASLSMVPATSRANADIPAGH
jgi:hypothetical protein